MRWVTRQGVGVDRMASAWLIRRFIDQAAEFAFLPEGSALPSPEVGTAFDMPGATLSHRRGHCTFHTLVSVYQIDDPALSRLARIIDEADIVQEAPLEAGAAGLDLVCRGLGTIASDDDEALILSRPIFDGLYAYLQHQSAGG
ncbi:MAG: chromate resistance protein ChrB domain-containing protein [Sulfobacillus sp.]